MRTWSTGRGLGQLIQPEGNRRIPRRRLIVTTFTGNVLHYDIIAFDETGRHVSIQVKSSRSTSWQFGVICLPCVGHPECLHSDNGPEFVAKEVRKWLDQADVQTLFIAKGNPWESGYVESFNGRFRDELLNGELFLSLAEERWVIDRWRLDYNHRRPLGSLDYQPSRMRLCSSSFGYASASRTQPGYLTPILSLRLVLKAG
jgi:transposase InsO family protein